MRILHVVRQFHPSVGGVERFTLDLCRETREAGHEVAVLTFDRDFASGEQFPAFSQIDGIPVQRVPYFGPRRYRVAPTVLRHLGMGDLLHVHCVDSFIDLLALTQRWHRKPIVLSTHGGFFHSSWGVGIKKLFFRLITPRSLAATSVIVCDSRQDMEVFSPLAPDKCVLIEDAIDFRKFSSITRTPQAGRLLYVGRTDANKRLDQLLTVFALVQQQRPESRLQLVGPDWLGQWPALKRQAGQLGIDQYVEFAGRVSEEELMRRLGEAQFFVSASSYEGFGLSVAEAMAAGVPPLLNDIDAFRNLTANGRGGVLIDYDQPQLAAGRLLQLMALAHTDYDRLAQQARQTASRYSWQETIGRFIEVYERALHGI